MANYLEMSREELVEEERTLQAAYKAFQNMGLKLNMARGKPGPHQMDLAMDLFKTTDYTAADGTDARNYGNLEGLYEARQLFGEVMGVKPENVFVGGNSSLQLMYFLVSIGYTFGFPESPCPWSQVDHPKFLCPVPGYDRHFRITEEFGIDMINVPMTPEGPDMDMVEKLAAEDPSIKGIWCVPIFSNPTGAVYDDHTVSRLARMATAAPDFRVIWDNAYVVHTLTTDFPKVPDVDTLAAEAGHPNRFLQVCSTSKITFAGAGVSFLSASAANLDWYLGHASIRTIGPNKVNQLAHARFFGDAEGVRAHMLRHRQSVAPKFEAADAALTRRLGEYGIARWAMPEGGYFIDLEVVDGTATETVRLAKGLGVALTPAGSAYPYGNDPDDRHIRLAPTLPPLAEVETAMDVVGLCVLLAACRAAA